MIRVRILQILLVVVPLAIVVGVLHGLGQSCRLSRLPDGYVLVEETDHWRVYGPHDEPNVAGAGPAIHEFMRRFHATYESELSLSPRGEQLTIYLFRDGMDFRRTFESRLSDDTSRIAGFYSPVNRSIAAIAPDGLALSTLRHETVHAILDLDVRGSSHAWPDWLNEGLAQAFEEPRLVDGRLVPGPLDPGQADLLRRVHVTGRLVRTLDLVSLDHDTFMADSPVNYAHAAALTLYLLEQRREEFLAHYEKERLPGPLAPRVFRVRFGDDLRVEMMAWVGP